MQKIDFSEYKNSLSRRNQIIRFIWSFVWTVFARPLPRSIGRLWKIYLLRIFGAKIHSTANVYSSVKIYLPSNLEMGAYSCLASDVDCYNVDKVILEANVIVSQKVYLCPGSHNINTKSFDLITAPIIIKNGAWIATQAFIGMGVTIGEGAVVGATASVYKDVEAWTIVGGNPAKYINKREIK
ncbi:MAG: putative colanic acid biosynthesis acetyltransferase [Bacteroidales bacterium]|nr:putative colanic acid biosynthesis acetyltransferase [Bacteroidales bacterium]